MSKVVNLRLARKAKARAGEAEAAQQNRAFYGRTKAEKQKAKAALRATEKKLDAHKRDRGA
ncbi:MAG: DUF4169 family protein [Caulobacterales bacterium]